MVVAYNKDAIRKIKKLRKKIANEPEAKPEEVVPNIPVNEPKPAKKSRK